ncbi:MAG: ornithine carbamoyltransferase [Actinobacteria bacterium]|nr:ornithine carbamoyltransferase [Actinomycetota bacterium]
MTRHLLDVTDLTTDELRLVLQLAQRTDLPPVLAGKGVALIFEKPSNRTRHSMEMAVVRLGGHPVYTRGEEVGFDDRESVEDITRVMGGYHDVLGVRTLAHSIAVRMTMVSAVPVVNLLSERAHPLQAIADVLTMQQVHGTLDGRTIAFVGDYNNVSRSLAEACVMLGAQISLGCPVGYHATDEELQRLNLLGSGAAIQAHAAAEAVAGAIAVHTDSWTSMGQEAERGARAKAFERFTITEQVMAAAEPGAGFYHCLPASRGVEVTAEVIDGPQSHVFAQAHNRLHAACGALAFLMGVC